MKSKEKAKLILAVCRPKKRNAGLFGVAFHLLSGAKPNTQQNIYKRTMDACDGLQEDIHFLAGILTVLPFLHLRRDIQLNDDGEKLLIEAHSFSFTCQPSTASIRKMRIFGERILRVRGKG